MTRFALLVPTAVLAPDSATNRAASATATETFVASVATGNLFEIESSKLALDRTKSDRIKTLANRMIEDHGAAALKFRQAVSDANLRAPPEKLDAKHQAAFDDLKARDAGAFDSLSSKETATVDRWRKTIVGVAIEEMGHWPW